MAGALHSFSARTRRFIEPARSPRQSWRLPVGLGDGDFAFPHTSPRRPGYVTACRLAQHHARKPFSGGFIPAAHENICRHTAACHGCRSPTRSLPGPAGPAINTAGSAPSSPTRRCSPSPASSGPDTTPHPLMPAGPGAGGRAAAGRRTKPPRDTLGRPLRSAICHGRPAKISPVVSPAAFRRPQRRKGAPRSGERITPTPPDHSRLKVGSQRSERDP